MKQGLGSPSTRLELASLVFLMGLPWSFNEIATSLSKSMPHVGKTLKEGGFLGFCAFQNRLQAEGHPEGAAVHPGRLHSESMSQGLGARLSTAMFLLPFHLLTLPSLLRYK